MKFIIILFVIIAGITIASSNMSLSDFTPDISSTETTEDSDKKGFGETLFRALFPSRSTTKSSGTQQVDYQPSDTSGTTTIDTLEEPSVSDISPYQGKVSLSSVKTKSSPFSMTLRTRISAGESIDITGWAISGNAGGFKIQQGVEKYHSVSNTFLSNIVLKQSDKVLIVEGQSPFGKNASFRPNLCFGYLQPFYNFIYSVPKSCPDRVTLGEVSYLSPICQEFILNNVKTSSCSISDQTVIQGDPECLSFIENRYNYDACYSLHSKESSFDKSEWHVYIERSFGHPLHDTIELLDENGLLVDSYIY